RLRPGDHAISAGHETAKLDFSPATESLLAGAIFHLQRKPERMQPGVHGFVKDRCRDLGVGEVRIDAEGELDEARALLDEIRATTRKTLYDDVIEVSLEVPEMVRHVLLNEQQASFESRNDVGGRDIGPGIFDNHRNPQNFVAGDPRHAQYRAQKTFKHV